MVSARTRLENGSLANPSTRALSSDTKTCTKAAPAPFHLCSLLRMHGNQGSSCLLLGPESRAAKMPISGTAVSAPKDV